MNDFVKCPASNRTRLELKQCQRVDAQRVPDASNRTRLELKPWISALGVDSIGRLIEPGWN